MLKINHLTITTLKGRKLLEDFSFVLEKGDKIALIGEEGNGKSTLLKIMAGIDVDSYVTFSGSIDCDERIGYLPQKLNAKEMEKSVIDYIDEDPDYNHLYTLIPSIDIDVSLIDDRKMKTLSGGERVRIMLLKILYEDPDILLLDEPSNDLDLKTLIWLEEFMIATRLPMIFISHDETLLSNCANGILHLEQLKRKSEPHMSYAGTDYQTYSEERLAYIKRNNMIAAKQRSELKKQMDKWRQIYQKVEYRQTTISRQDPHGGQLLKKKMHAVKAQEKVLEKKKENLLETYEPEEAIDIFFEEVHINPNKVILDAHIDALYAEDKLLGQNIDLKIFGKDKICIIGDNGSGKTTLLKKIYELMKGLEGVSIGYMPQNYDELLDNEITPIEYLWDGRKREELGKVRSFLGALRFTSEEMEHKIKELSEGQKCKILLVKMILSGNEVLLLDEPTRNLSPLSGPKIRQILCDFKGTIISISHDRKFIEEVADKVYELKDGRLRLLD